MTQAVLWCALPFSLSGCAVHYGDTARGIEHVWGLGRVTWEKEVLTNDLAAVSSGFRLPGLVFGVGPDFFGVNFGYHVRERLQIVALEEAAACESTLNGHHLASATKGRWGIGWFVNRLPPDAGLALVQGKAAAGLHVAVERSKPSLAAGWQSRQITVVNGEDVFVELTSPTCPWPHFDFPGTTVSADRTHERPPSSSNP